jgi:ribosomal protein S18 acetylase RimI-like enzyme
MLNPIIEELHEVREAFAKANESGLRVAVNNSRAIALYESMGFDVEGGPSSRTNAP